MFVLVGLYPFSAEFPRTCLPCSRGECGIAQLDFIWFIIISSMGLVVECFHILTSKC